MSDIATSPAQYGDSRDTLWLKIATAFQAYAGITPSGGDMLTGTPRVGDTYGNILKSTYALQN